MKKSPRERRVLITGSGMSAVAAAMLHRIQEGEVLTEPSEKDDIHEKKVAFSKMNEPLGMVDIENRRVLSAPTRHAQTKEAARRLRQMERKKK